MQHSAMVIYQIHQKEISFNELSTSLSNGTLENEEHQRCWFKIQESQIRYYFTAGA